MIMGEDAFGHLILSALTDNDDRSAPAAVARMPIFGDALDPVPERFLFTSLFEAAEEIERNHSPDEHEG